MAHIEKINEKLMVQWTEDQPVIRPVKNHFIRSGVVAELVDLLINNGSDAVGRKESLSGSFDRVLLKGDYVCLVQRLPSGSPAFDVAIKRYSAGASNALDAVGEVYVAPFPDWISDAYNQLHSTSQAGR